MLDNTKLSDLLTEVAFTLYQGMVRIKHKEETTASEVADFVRAMPGVTRVSAVDSDETTHTVVLKVKVLTARPPQDTYKKLQKDMYRLVPNIKQVELSLKSIQPI